MMIWLLAVTCLVLKTSAVSADCMASADDACTGYKTLDDETRSTGYYNGNDPLETDFSLNAGWYRSVSPAGSDMPTEIPQVLHCQSKSPVYLESKKSTTNGVEVWKACARSFASTCESFYDVCIKQCDGFKVYYLNTVESTNDRYCFGKEVRCQPGETSPNGFSPGCSDGSDILDADPIVDFKIEKTEIGDTGACESTTVFTCGNEGANIGNIDKVEVEWVIGAASVMKKNVDTASLPAELSVQEIRDKIEGVTYPFTLTCKMTKLDDNGATTGLTRSTGFYAGYKADNTILNVVEGTTAEYGIEFTVPFNCIFPCAVPQCTVHFNVEVPENACDEVVDGECKKYLPCANRKQLTFERAKSEDDDFCTFPYAFDPMDKDNLPNVKIPVKAIDDFVYDGNTEINLQVGLPEVTGDKLWEAVDFPKAQVFITDANRNIAGRYCHYYNDPHAKTTDGKRYEMQFIGTYLLYQHKRLPIQIQGLFGEVPGRRWTRVCGVAIRSGGDLYVINYCGKTGFYTKFYSCGKAVDIGVDADVTNLEVVKSGNNYNIYLPTGTKVIVYSSYIKIIPAVEDLDNIEGQCGPFNLDTSDDFTLPDGTITTSNVEFAKAWRVPDSESLFFGKITDDREFDEVLFCSCEGDKDDLAAACGLRGNGNCVAKAGTDLTEKLKGRCASTLPGDDIEEEDEYDPIDEKDVEEFEPEKPEWQDPWTEEKAKEHCDKFFSDQKASIEKCKDREGIDVEDAKEKCVLDIKISGTTDYTQVHMQGIIDQCLEEIDKDVDLNKPDENGETEADKIKEDVCPGDCSDQGECVKGVCECDEGFGTEDCSLDLHHIPKIKGIVSKGLCDLKTRPCEKTPVRGDLFIDTPNLFCKAEIEGGETLQKEAEYENFEKCHCALPKCETTPCKISISVSNDNVGYSNIQTVMVYNSDCWTCKDEECVQNAKTCFIEQKCYNANDLNPEDENEECDPDKSQTEWSEINPCKSV